VTAKSAGPKHPPALPSGWWTSIGHDLRGSIAPMRLALQLLRKGQLATVDRDSALQMIDQQIDRLLMGIDDLADLLRLNADSFALRLAAEDLNFAMDIVCGQSSLLKTIEEKQQSLRCLPTNSPVIVNHDSSRMVALLEYLIEKSAAHAPAGATLTLELQQDGERAWLRITGAGNSLAADADLAYVIGAASGLPGKPQARAILMREIARLNQVAFAAIDEKTGISLSLPILQQ
jgi:K+-sensing histidine kinase KdpD